MGEFTRNKARMQGLPIPYSAVEPWARKGSPLTVESEIVREHQGEEKEISLMKPKGWLVRSMA